jgi:hypothetical protein
LRISRNEKRSHICSGRHAGNEAQTRDNAFPSSNHQTSITTTCARRNKRASWRVGIKQTTH